MSPPRPTERGDLDEAADGEARWVGADSDGTSYATDKGFEGFLAGDKITVTDGVLRIDRALDADEVARLDELVRKHGISGVDTPDGLPLWHPDSFMRRFDEFTEPT